MIQRIKRRPFWTRAAAFAGAYAAFFACKSETGPEPRARETDAAANAESATSEDGAALGDEAGFHVGATMPAMAPLSDAQILAFASHALTSLAGTDAASVDGSLHTASATSLALGVEPPGPGPNAAALDGVIGDPQDAGCLPATGAKPHREDASCSDDGEAWDAMRGTGAGAKMCPNHPDFAARTLYCATAIDAGRASAAGSLAMAKGILCALEKSAGADFVAASGASTRTIKVDDVDECFDAHTAALLAARNLSTFEITVETKNFPPAAAWDREIKLSGAPIKSPLGLVVYTKSTGEFAAARLGTEVSVSVERRAGLLRFEQLANGDGRHLRLLAEGEWGEDGTFVNVTRLEALRSRMSPPSHAAAGAHAVIATMKGDLNRGYRLRSFTYDCATAAEGGTCTNDNFLKVGAYAEKSAVCLPDGADCRSEPGLSVDYDATPFLAVARGYSAEEQATIAAGWNGAGPLCFNEVTTDLLPNQSCGAAGFARAATARMIYLTRELGDVTPSVAARRECDAATKAPFNARFSVDLAKIDGALREAMANADGVVVSATIATTAGASTWTNYSLDATLSVDEREAGRVTLTTPTAHAGQPGDLTMALDGAARRLLASGRSLNLDVQGWAACVARGDELESHVAYGVVIGTPVLVFARPSP